VHAFFDWIDRQFERQGLLPSSPFTQALGYARERRVGLEVFLDDPDVPMDTNHLERALRVIPMGRRNWLFTWTELGEPPRDSRRLHFLRGLEHGHGKTESIFT